MDTIDPPEQKIMPNEAQWGAMWGSSLYLGEWGFGKYPTSPVSITTKTLGGSSGKWYVGSGNVFCSSVKQNIYFSDLNATTSYPAGYQGASTNSMYYNGGDLRYIIIDICFKSFNRIFS